MLNLSYSTHIPQRNANGNLGNNMKDAYLKPEHFDHVFYTYITFFGSQKKVICAFDEPDDVHVWLHDNNYNVTYDIKIEDSRRIESFAHEILEQA
jgi:hypothetical protein